MGLPKGRTNNPNGRPTGSKNKKTLAKKEEIENLFRENGGFELLFNSINAIDDPKDKANTLLKTMEYFVSKEKTLELTGDDLFKNIQIIEDDGEDSESNDKD